MTQSVYLKWVFLLFIIGCKWTYAQPLYQTISEQQLQDKITLLSEHVGSLSSLESVAEINESISIYSPTDQTVLKHLFLRELGYQEALSEQHRLWISANIASEDVLAGYYSDHPEKQIVLINIANQARATLHMLDIKQLKGEVERQWQSGEFQWTNWLQANSKHYQALLQWLNQQESEIENIKQHFLQQYPDLTIPNNEVLALLINKSASKELFAILWQREIDEFTYQVIHHLPKSNDEELVVAQLIESMNIRQLTSQSLLSLAAHYPLNESSQLAIAQSLENPDKRWFGLMALSNMPAPEFKQNLLSKYKQQKTSFAVSATKMLQGQLNERELQVEK